MTGANFFAVQTFLKMQVAQYNDQRAACNIANVHPLQKIGTRALTKLNCLVISRILPQIICLRVKVATSSEHLQLRNFVVNFAMLTAKLCEPKNREI